MQWSRCQHENPADDLLCQECGKRLEVACPGCGTANQLGAKFCKKCGQPVATMPAVAAAAKSPSPESYTPKHLAEKILTSKSALEGERKQVTVLFADLKGSMELLADRDPEEARKILDPVLERMMEAVHRYEGTVNQVMGDGIMALFGAPLAHEDHAVRACYAALRMQASVTKYAGQLRSQGLDVQIRVGLNSGEVVVRSIGSDLRLDYSAVGQTTHLAARMEQTAVPGTIRLTTATHRLAVGLVQVRSLGPIGIKGLTDSLETLELVGLEPSQTRLEASARRGLTPLVGREAELDLLRQIVDRAGRGAGQVAALVGEAGIGKSRLVWELIRSQLVRDWLILTGRSQSYSAGTPYIPVVEMLKAYFRLESQDDFAAIRSKVTEKLLSRDRALESALVPILALLDVPSGDEEWPALDPLSRQQRTLEAIKQIFLHESHEQPLLLVVEDLHWVDAATQQLLNRLVSAFPAARIMLLVTSRPGDEHRFDDR